MPKLCGRGPSRRDGCRVSSDAVRLEVEGGKLPREERLLRDLGARIRGVRHGPDGLIYLLTDAAG